MNRLASSTLAFFDYRQSRPDRPDSVSKWEYLELQNLHIECPKNLLPFERARHDVEFDLHSVVYWPIFLNPKAVKTKSETITELTQLYNFAVSKRGNYVN